MKLENIDKSIQKQDILQGISLEVSPQKLTAFIGPNGAGKSTLLSIMSRLTKKDQGVLSIKGREIESWNSQELAQELTILKQKINYQAKLTVEELVSFGRFPYSRGRLRSEDWEKIRETLNYLELTNLKDRYINSLSGGATPARLYRYGTGPGYRLYLAGRTTQQSRYQAKRQHDADSSTTGGGTRQDHYHRPPRYQHGQSVCR